MLRPLAFLSLLCAATLGPGCKSDAADHDHDHGHLDYCDLPLVCQEIVLACHPKDDGTNAEISGTAYSFSPIITRAASEASGLPMVLETNGTVRDARGFTSST